MPLVDQKRPKSGSEVSRFFSSNILGHWDLHLVKVIAMLQNGAV